ncbi:MAG: hypothetical protein A2283_08025 [Lentisphaerae bacterium RIFOXYA12_FULL_48_11]|nr:MAG: hypothetical protein A2283_08025 [Lentisphaerae bacterium RIFOXYA12_FULL_48_11]
MNVEGSAVYYAREFGGATTDICNALAVDSNSNVHAAGITYSADFPLSNACDAVFGGSSEGFYMKADTNGNLMYSTFLGGAYSDEANGVCVDAMGQVLVVGTTSSSNFPLRCPLDDLLGGSEVFMTRLSPDTNGMFMSSFYGGSTGEFAYAAVICPSAVVAVVGQTFSSDFRLYNACDSNMVGAEAFVAIWSGVDDADGDSMTDAHEILYGHNPSDARDGALDTDNDGMLNVEEWITGTDPTNNLSVFQIDSFQNDSLEINSVSGRLYTLDTCLDLIAGAWTNDPAQTVVTGTAAPISLVVTNNSPRTFYRVRVKMP